MTLSGTITAAALNAEFDAFRAVQLGNRSTGARGQRVRVNAYAIAPATAIETRSVTFTPQWDAEVLALGVATFGHAVFATDSHVRLEPIDTLSAAALPGELHGGALVVAVQTAIGLTEAHSRTSYAGTHWLRTGQTYRLSVDSDVGTIARIQGLLTLGVRRHR